jgi:hypothetical protein
MFQVHIIPTMNPDGFAAVSRQNGNGKDLNQNFPTYKHIGKSAAGLKVRSKPLILQNTNSVHAVQFTLRENQLLPRIHIKIWNCLEPSVHIFSMLVTERGVSPTSVWVIAARLSNSVGMMTKG